MPWEFHPLIHSSIDVSGSLLPSQYHLIPPDGNTCCGTFAAFITDKLMCAMAYETNSYAMAYETVANGLVLLGSLR